MIIRFIFILGLVASLTGCMTKMLKSLDEQTSGHFMPADLVQHTGTEKDARPQSALGPITDLKIAGLIEPDEQDLERAFRTFDTKCGTGEVARCRLLRNSVQDRLIASSNAICREYKNSLKRNHAETNASYGSLSTIFGGIGALATSTTPARLFSGAAAMTNGMRAEINQSLYSMLAIEVITKAIDKGRQDALKEIDRNQKLQTGDYSIERAFADSEEYHSRCSLLAGLQEASAAVSQVSDSGVSALNRTLESWGQTATIELAKKTGTNGPPKSLAPVCLQLGAEFDSFLSARNISKDSAEFAAPVKRWNAALLDGGCVDGGVKLDQEWTTLFGKLSRSTNDIERVKYLSEISAQQTQVGRDAKYLSDTLASALNQITATLDSKTIDQQKAELAIAVDNLKSITATQSIDKAALLAALQKATSLTSALEKKIAATYNTLPTGTRSAVQTAITLAQARSASDQTETLKQAAVSLARVYDEHLKDWKPK